VSTFGATVRTLEGHTDWVRSVCLSSNDGMVMSGSRDNTVRLWDRSSGVLLRTLEGHRGSVNSVCLSSDDGMVVSGSFDNTVRLWDRSRDEV
jgi:WD40 repeat protein